MFTKWRRESKEQDKKRIKARYGDSESVKAPKEVLRKLDRETLASLPPSVLASLPVERIFDLPENNLSPELLSRISPGLITTLSPDHLSRLGNLPWSTLQHLPVETLSYLPPSALANLPSERLSLLPAETLSRLPWSTIITLPPETLARLPMSTLITLPPETLAKLSSDAISRLPQRIRQHVPEELLDAFKSLPSEPPPSAHREQSTQQQHQQLDASNENRRAAPNQPDYSKSDTNNAKPQKRASHQYLRRQSRGELRGTSQADNSGPGSAPGSRPSEIRVTSPLGALIAEAHGLHQEGYRRGSSSPNHASSYPPSTERSSPDPSPNLPTGTNKVIAESPHGRPSTPRIAVEVEETRIPSSGSRKSGTNHHTTRRSWEDTRPEEPTLLDGQTAGHLPSSRDSPDILAPKKPPRQYSSAIERHLQQSLKDREPFIAEFEANLDKETREQMRKQSEVSDLQAQLRKNQNVYETELADIRNVLAKEQARREQTSLLLSKTQTELAGEKDELHKRIKGLKSDIFAQKSQYDQRLQEQQQMFDVEQAHSRRELDEVTYKYERKLAKLSDYVSQMAMLKEDLSNRDAEHKTRLQGLEQVHRDQIGDLNAQLQEQEASYQTRISQLTKSHSDDLRNLAERHQNEAAQVKDNLNTYIDTLRHKYENRIQTGRDQLQREIHTMSENHQRAIQEQALAHSQRSDSLRAQAGDFMGQTSDDNLKGRFRKLKIAVEVIAEPFNLGAVVIHPGSGLDPSGFLQRERGMQRHLLRSLVWARIVDGFFSAPFGFGVLGSGTGKRMLVDLFLHWRRLFAAHQVGDTATEVCTADGSFDLYDLWRDRETNRWRSATFQSVMAVVIARDGKRGEFDGPEMEEHDPFSINRAMVRNDILNLLNEATNNHVASGIQEKVSEVTCLAAELALEVGAHRGCLGLESPEKGDTVAIGPDFVDCEDGDAARGDSEEVELVVCPRFFKIGDGRNDLMTRKSIFPGEIYPVRT